MHGETLDITIRLAGVTSIRIEKFVEWIDTTGWLVMISPTTSTLFRYIKILLLEKVYYVTNALT